MVTFIGEPNMLVTLKQPIGTIKHFRFDGSGNFTTDNERLIQRLHHKFDSVPTPGANPSDILTDDLEYQDHGQSTAKHYKCDQCDFTHENKGVLLRHKKEHIKED